MSDLGSKIKRVRIAKNLTQTELAEKLNVNRSAISYWESNTKTPTFDNIVELAKIVGVTLDYFNDNSPRQTMSQIQLQLESVFKNAGIPEADIDKAWQDMTKIYIQSKEARAQNKTTVVESYDLLDLKEE